MEVFDQSVGTVSIRAVKLKLELSIGTRIERWERFGVCRTAKELHSSLTARMVDTCGTDGSTTKPTSYSLVHYLIMQQ